MTCLYIPGRSVWDIVNLISIMSTGQSSLQPQILIEFWMSGMIIPVSLLQLGGICLLKKNQLANLKKIT